MAVAPTGTAGTLTKAAGGSSGGTIAMTIPADADCIVVTIHSSTAVTFSGVTCGGVAMTQLGTRTQTNGTAGSQIWGLKAPLTGAQNVVISSSGAWRGGATAQCYKGVDQTNPFGTFVSVNVASGNTATVNPTAGVDDLVVDAWTCDLGDSVTTCTPGGSQTVVANFNGSAGAGGTAVRCSASYRGGAGGATAMTWTATSAGQHCALGAIPLLAAAAATPMAPGGTVRVVNRAAIHRASRW